MLRLRVHTALGALAAFAAVSLAACGDDEVDEPTLVKQYAERCFTATNTQLRTEERDFPEDLKKRMRASVRSYCGCAIEKIRADKGLSDVDRKSIFSRTNLLSNAGVTDKAKAAMQAAIKACARPFVKANFAVMDEYLKRKKAGKVK